MGVALRPQCGPDSSPGKPPLDRGHILAEAEFELDEDMARATAPAGVIEEVTRDERFTGGNFVRLARAGLEELPSSMR